jgi:Rrf2 family protein
MLQLTRQTAYAMKIMAYMARRPGELVSRKVMIVEAEVPGHFSAKIAQELAKKKLIEVKQGSRGGLKLTCDPAKVTQLDIYEAMNGDLDIQRGLELEGTLKAILTMVNRDVRTAMKSVLLEDMAAGRE